MCSKITLYVLYAKQTNRLAHDGEYRRALKDFNSYATTLYPHLMAIDETIPELPLKDTVYRIYRDTRFSKDPTPYKPYFSAAWSRTGRKGPYAVYYLHCEPDTHAQRSASAKLTSKAKSRPANSRTSNKTTANSSIASEWSTSCGNGSSLIAGGLWSPDKDALALIRASIDNNPLAWHDVLSDPLIVATFLASNDPKAVHDSDRAIAAFATHSSYNALKTKPRDYAANHEMIQLLKLRSFVLTRRVADEVFTSESGQETIAGLFKALEKFVSCFPRLYVDRKRGVGLAAC